MRQNTILIKTINNQALTIRYPKKSDLLSLLNFINTLSKERTFIRNQGEKITLEQERKYLKDVLEKIKKKQTVHLEMFLGKTLIGNSQIVMKDRVEKHIGGFGISVIKEYRDKGLGTLLIGTVLQEAKKVLPDIKIVILEVYANNPRAIHLYKKMGFKPYGKLPKGIIYKKKYVDSIFMYKNI